MKFFEETYKHTPLQHRKHLHTCYKDHVNNAIKYYSENNTKLINTLCKQDTELFFC